MDLSLGSRWMRILGVVVPVLVLTVALAAVPAAAKRQTFAVHATDHDPGGRPTGVRCQGGVSPCDLVYEGTVFYQGDFVGTGHYTLYFQPGLDGKAHYTGQTVFAGSVSHCGKGGMTIRYYDGTADPITRTSRDRWSIVPGSGTGGLRGISGSGIDVIRENLPSTDGTVTGTVTCETEKAGRPPHRTAASGRAKGRRCRGRRGRAGGMVGRGGRGGGCHRARQASLEGS